MQPIRKKLTTEWVEFATFINTTVNTNDKYRLCNRGNSDILLLETDTAPAVDNIDGDPLVTNEKVTFTKPESSTLYLRALNDETYINITKVS